MSITGKNLIDGEHSAEGEHTFTSVAPRTKQPGDVAFHDATEGEIDRAVEVAVDAFAETRNYPPTKLADFLDVVANEIEALGDELLQTTDMETALGLPRLSSERTRTTNQLRAFGNLLREGSYVEAIIDTPDDGPDVRRMLFPLGPVAVFSASNFPYAFAVAGGDTASAFAAGCPVIVKGHPGHPATSELFGNAISSAIDKTGFPYGFFSLLQGERVEVGQALVKHPDIEAVGFTGSQRAGRAIYDLAASRDKPIPVYAEMGSVNPLIVLPGALQARRDEIAEGLVNSVTLGAGQFCTNPGLVFVLDTPEAQSFIAATNRLMKEQKTGVLLNANVERNLTQTVAKTLEHPQIERLTGDDLIVESGGYNYPHTVMQTTSEALREDESLQVEHFGPVTLFVLCDSLEDMQETLETLHGNLAAAVHAEENEMDDAGALYDLLREKVGRLIWNGFPTGVAVVYAMQHGGPYPATTAPLSTSVGMTAIKRFMRPVAFQDVPDALLPDALKNANPLGLLRIVNNQYTRNPVQ